METEPLPSTRNTPGSGWALRITGGPGILLALLWGFAEGTLFFLIPDILLSIAAALHLRRSLRHCLAATAGAMLGGALLFSWAARDYGAARGTIARVPFLRAHMFEEVARGYERRGVRALLRGPWTGTPYKIFAVQAPGRVGAVEFLLVTVPARAQRFVAVALLFGLAGNWLRQRRGWTPGWLLAVSAAVWVLFYAAYWTSI